MGLIKNSIAIPESLTIPVRLLLCFLFSVFSLGLDAQQKVKKEIKIEKADYLLYDQSIIEDAQRLIGNVKISHSNIVMFCDSAWSYQSSNSVDAYGRVHIISNDTLHLYADIIHYKGNLSLAEARGNVVLKDPKLTLTTDSLDFDTKQEIGYYNFGGKIIDSTNTLTSKIGRYYSQIDELFFNDSVKLVNKDYTMTSDTMRYNTKNEIVYIVGPTHIIGDSSYLYSENGWFDTKKNISELLTKSTIRKGNTQLQGDYINYDDNSGKGFAKGNVIINDFENSIIVAGNNATYNDFSQNALISDSALFIQYQNNDSLFLHADTLFTQPDTSAQDQKMVIANNNVRFFKNTMQGACDSLIYFTKDSTIQLFYDPILWSDNNQLSADYIEVVNNNEPPNQVYMKNNSFIIQEIDSSKFNQIKGKNMVGLLNGSQLYRIDVNGNGQSIYFPADDNDFIGMNKAESSNIILYITDNKINRISFVKSPLGTLSPINKQIDTDSRLPDFKWRGNERPLNKLDIFRNNNGLPLPINLPKSNIENPLPEMNRLKQNPMDVPQNSE